MSTRIIMKSQKIISAPRKGAQNNKTDAADALSQIIALKVTCFIVKVSIFYYTNLEILDNLQNKLIKYESKFLWQY